MQSKQIYAIGVEYLGHSFSGWQFQGHQPNTIQHFLQEAISFVANQPTQVLASGRTDAGVHALEQICHFESSANRSLFNWRQGANTRLPREIRVKWVAETSADFHARYKALFRDYIYIIHQTEVSSAVWGRQVTSWRKPLNVVAMNQAVKLLIGEHDFSAFRATGCQAKHPVRRIFEADVWQQGEFIAVAIRGNAFLQHMVRNIVGNLLVIGEQLQAPEWIDYLLQQRNRHIAAPTAAASGLYFRTSHYSDKFGLKASLKSPFGLFDDKLALWPAHYSHIDFGHRHYV